MKTTAERNRKNGRYEENLDRVCKCGHRKGEHLAEYPYPQDDGFQCEGFKAAKK